MIKTRASILKSFTKNVRDLRALAKKHENKAKASAAQAGILRAQSQEDNNEAIACNTVANKIEEMISV